MSTIDDPVARILDKLDNEGSAVLNAVEGFLRRFIAYPSEHAAVAHTLWVAHTHRMDAWESTPRMFFSSTEPGSGKTRGLEVTELLVPRPVHAVNTTPAYLFRKVSDEAGSPTILYDEIDTLFGPRAKENEDVRGMLNAGHRKGAVAGRCVVKGKEVTTEELPAYCAVAMAGLDNLPDTLMSRSIVIKMRRRAPGEEVEPFRHRQHAPEGEALKSALSDWAAKCIKVGAWPEMPEGVTDRNADVWEALLAVADAAGGDWPERARVSAVTLVTDAKAGVPSLGIRLLADIRDVFGDHDYLFTDDAIAGLVALEEAPWGDLRGKALDPRGLAQRLAKYDVRPRTVRIGTRTSKGYAKADFVDPWSRYLSVTEREAKGGGVDWGIMTRSVNNQSVGAAAYSNVTSVTPSHSSSDEYAIDDVTPTFDEETIARWKANGDLD